MLSDYQTRVIEAATATLRQNLPALRDSLDSLAAAIRRPHTPPDESTPAWLQLEETLGHLDLLNRARDHFVNSSSTGATFSAEAADGPEVICNIRRRQLGELLEALHAIAGTPIEGYISEDCS